MNSLVSSRFSSTRARKVTRLKYWNDLCDRYLPVAHENSIWRFHRPPRREDPEQGWKLHVSATVLNANLVLGRIAPFLAARGVQFKAPNSLEEVKRLNSGMDYSYTQIGKVITVYPRSDSEAVVIARKLHGLTRHLSAPGVPFDLRYIRGSNVYYRYGAFRLMEMDLQNGARVPALKNPEGILVPDLYRPEMVEPSWAKNPFPIRRGRTPRVTPLNSTFRVFRALSQRGKGGVYQAVDLSTQPPRLCLIKEGRKAGELGWDRRDGRWRVKHEERVLVALRERGVNVPSVHSSFELTGNYYLVTEFIEGENLLSYLLRKKRRLSVARALKHGLELAKFISQVHGAGWVWRDCKPSNLILTNRGELRSLDFEGACPIDRRDTIAWLTPAFAPPVASRGGYSRPLACDDLFAFGTILYLLLIGRMPQDRPLPLTVQKLRSNTPPEVAELISELLNPDAKHLLEAHEIANQLTGLLTCL